MKAKQKRRNLESPKNCYMCENCTYVGEGGYMCENSLDIVVEDWAPTDEFFSCEGKAFVGMKRSNIEKAKADAIKEFAEKTHKMITEIYNKHIFGNYDLEDEEKEAIMDFSLDITSGFDDLVKEMTK